jgi:hypothetical protein
MQLQQRHPPASFVLMRPGQLAFNVLELPRTRPCKQQECFSIDQSHKYAQHVCIANGNCYMQSPPPPPPKKKKTCAGGKSYYHSSHCVCVCGAPAREGGGRVGGAKHHNSLLNGQFRKPTFRADRNITSHQDAQYRVPFPGS